MRKISLEEIPANLCGKPVNLLKAVARFPTQAHNADPSAGPINHAVRHRFYVAAVNMASLIYQAGAITTAILD